MAIALFWDDHATTKQSTAAHQIKSNLRCCAPVQTIPDISHFDCSPRLYTMQLTLLYGQLDLL